MKKSILIIIALLTITEDFQAQFKLPKWGKLSKEEIEIKECSFEEGADAIVLADFGTLQFGNERVVIKRHRRIKVIHEKGVERANVSIPFYVKNKLENISNVKGQTINIDPNGKAVSIKVQNDEIFEVDNGENWKEIRMVFPGVRKGSVLEYSYIIYSRNFTFLDGWIFQSDLPTLKSQFKAIIPEDINYRVLLQGQLLSGKYSQSEPVNEWSLENIPAIKEEPYVANYMDYAEKIRFQLAGYTKHSSGAYSTAEHVTTMTTWEKLATELLRDSNFSSYLNKKNKAEEMLAPIIKDSDPDIKKLEKIYNFVNQNYQWDHKYRIFTQQSFNEFVLAKQGNSVEINLLLTLLLNKAGLNANPVLISTRKHGIVTKSYPFLSQFNHIISNVNINGKDYLLDATDPNRPYHLLDKNDLNNFAYLMDLKASRWLTVEAPTNAKKTVYVNADFSSDHISYDVTVKLEGYYALSAKSEVGKNKYESNLTDRYSDDFEINNITIGNYEAPDKPLDIKLNLTEKDKSDLTRQIVYLEPMLLDEKKENPFKSERRYYPIEFSYNFKEKFVLILKLPINYKIDQLPESTKIRLPDNYGLFTYQIRHSNGVIQLIADFEINKSTIPNTHYSALKEFYNLMIAKFSESIVLRKIE